MEQESLLTQQVIIRQLGQQDYQTVLTQMHTFTDERNDTTADEIWFVEHPPVFTQGQAGKEEHLLNTGDIPVLQSDRGGQVTYHGLGQLVAYVMIDLRRKQISVRDLVTNIENTIINTLARYAISSQANPDAPGVYVNNQKIASLGLRIRKGCSFHGLALNVNMDLTPFLRINPCGYQGLKMTQVADLGGPKELANVTQDLIAELTQQLNYSTISYMDQ